MQDYRKIRREHPFMPAKHALQWAKSTRYRDLWQPEGDAYVREHEGYTLRLTSEAESMYPMPNKHGDTDYGRYVDEVHPDYNYEWRGNWREPREHAPLGLPYTSIRYSGPGWVQGEGTGYFIPDGLEEQYDYFRKCGQSKSVAWDLTREWCEAQLKMLFSSPLENVHVTVTASKGVASASTSMGTEVSGDEEDYIFTMVEENDMIGEAISELEDYIESIKKL